MTGDTDITGTVRTPAGPPVVGACVEVRGYTEWPGPTANVVTDHQGVFRSTIWMHHWYDQLAVVVRDCSGAVPGFANTAAAVDAWPLHPTRFDVTVGAGNAIRGQLTNLFTGQSIAARYCIIGNVLDTPMTATWSNGDGSFTLRGLPPGTVHVSAHSGATCEPGYEQGAMIANQMIPISGSGVVVDVALPMHPR